MPTITFIEANGNEIKADATNGQTLMEAAVKAGVAAIAAECGGACACGTCHCYIAEPWSAKISPADAAEVDMLDFVIDPTEQSRLSCQVKVTDELDGMVVSVPESQT